MSRSDVQSAVRIILVGRTGLDAALRLDEAFELARVRTPHDALGELATPLDEFTPAATAVVVGHDVEAELLKHVSNRMAPVEGTPIPNRERLVDFIRGLRLVNPAVRILGVRSNGTPVLAPDLYDALAHPEHPGEDIRNCFAGTPVASAPSAAAPVQPAPIQPATSISPAPALESVAFTPSLHDPAVADGSVDAGIAGTSAGHTSTPPCSPEMALGDQALVEVAVRGQDVTTMAIEVLRHRVNDPGLAFLPPPASTAKSGAPQGVPVVWSDSVLGYLVPSRDLGMDLSSHARWLAGWMRLRDQQNQLRHAAFTDPLTSAWNRRYLDRFLSGAIDAAREQRWSVTVLMFDIDDFKRYNDEYGHDAGDEILSEVVRLLRAVTRPTDKVCRIGGDEFAVVFHEPEGPRSPDSKHPTTVHAIAQRFQQQILGHQFPKLSGCAPGTLTISGGLATFPWDGHTPAELLARADARAMESKRQGKNTITIGPGAVLRAL